MDLTDLVPSLKRALASPGEFDTTFPNSTDTDLAGTLADAVAECQLDGFFGNLTLDLAETTTTPDLTSPQQALVILYGMARVVRARIANLNNRSRYKAGIVESEVEQSATVLVQLLKDITARKVQILDDAKMGRLATAFQMVDMYIAKSIDSGHGYNALGAYNGYTGLGAYSGYVELR